MSGQNTRTWRRFVGMDVHRETIAICVLDEGGVECRVKRTIASRRQALREWLAAYMDPAVPTRFALEALSPARWVVAELRAAGFDVVLVHPFGVRLIVQSKKKSDRVDARALADLLRLGRLPAAYIATPEEQALRALVRHRESLRAEMTSKKNRIHAILHCNDEHFEGSDVFGKRGRAWLAARAFPEDERFVVDQLLAGIDALERQIAEADERIAARVEDDPFVALLRTIPGVGPAIAPALRAEAGDVRRFERPEQFAAYTGLVPATWESGGSRTGGGITKKGNHVLRWALVYAALHVCRWSAEWKTRYTRLRRRIKKHKARVAMARRLAVAIWHMAKTGEVFRYRERPPKEPKKPKKPKAA